MDPNWESRSEEKEWANEKQKLDNARKLRGIYFIDPEDGEHKETIKNARRQLEVQMKAAMLCKKETRFQKQSMRVLWKLTNQQESVWNHLYRKIMKITSQAKDTFR